MNNFNSVIDRALSEHTGSGIYNKKSNGKYSLFLPVTNTGELGSAPEQIEKTVIGNMAKSYIQGRKDSPQQTMTIYTNRDNLRIIKEYEGKSVDFLRVFPDFTGVKYSGTVDKVYTDSSLNAAEQLSVTVTITVPEEEVDDCFDLLEDTAIFTNDIPSTTSVAVGKTETVNVTTNPGDATVTVVSETESVATASITDGVVTITGVKAGSAIIELTASKDGYASWKRTIHVVVTETND